MRTGFTYVKTAEFVNDIEEPIDISLDDFELVILDSTGATVATLTLGSGLEIVGADTDKLNISVGPPTTGASGTYTGTLVWTRDETGAVLPIIDLIFIVS